ncbi:LacI family DNA-binding transcriptional regulator [soil metagenome]
MAGEALPTLLDVARQADVSLATASRALSGSRDRVSPALRDRVLAAAGRLNYVPNAQARALARASTSTVGLVVHDVSDPYFSEIARGVLRVATEHELLVLICNSFRDPERELEYIAALRGQRVAAIVLAGSGYTDAELERRIDGSLSAFEDAGGRATLVGRHRLSVDAVLPDNVGGAAAMTETLLEQGHRRIGVLAGPRHLTTVADRLRGVEMALRAAGVGLRPEALVVGDFTRDGGYSSTHRLVDQAPEVSVIFALNDAMAVGALAALRDRGVEVPGQVSVAGFDDIPATRDVFPTLSTVRLPMEEMGAVAMTLALRGRAKRARTRRMPSEVVLRASTAPPAG